MVLGIIRKGLTVDELLHLLLRQRVLFEVEVEGTHTDWLVTDVMERVQVRMGQCILN